MNWEAVGETVAVIGVLATLFYLSRQIKQNSEALSRANDYAQASSIHDTNALFVQVFSLLAQDKEMASIYHRALDGQPLNKVESVRYAAFLHVYFAWSEDMFCQAAARLGFVEHSEENAKKLLENECIYWERLLVPKVGDDWWNNEATHLFSRKFIEAIEGIRFAESQRRLGNID